MIKLFNFVFRLLVLVLIGLPVLGLLTLITFLTWDFKFYDLAEQVMDRFFEPLV